MTTRYTTWLLIDQDGVERGRGQGRGAYLRFLQIAAENHWCVRKAVL